MAAKIVDVTLATITNVGNIGVGPEGLIWAKVVRAVDDEQEFQSEALFHRNAGQPLHPGGAIGIPPGGSLTYNVIKRLTVHHFGDESPGQLNQMLIFRTALEQSTFISPGTIGKVPYFGPFSFKVRFDDILGSQTFPVLYNTTNDHKLQVTYTVNHVG
jgi:hypothetical protein